MKKNRTSHLLALLESSGENGITLTELHSKTKQKFKVTRKTIERDIIQLSLDYPILESDSYPVSYSLPSDYKRNHSFTINEQDIQTILLGLSLLRGSGPDGISAVALSAENGILDSLPPSMRSFAVLQRDLQKSFPSFEGKSLGTSERVIKSIFEALRRQKNITVIYSSPYTNKPTTPRMFSPLFLELTGNIPYISVLDCEDNKIKKLRLNRIAQVEVLKTSSPVTPEKLIKNYRSVGGISVEDQDFVDVELMGTQQLATYFEEFEVSENQYVEKIDDETFTIKIKIPLVSSKLRLLLSLSPEIVDIKPTKVKRMIKQMLKSASENMD